MGKDGNKGTVLDTKREQTKRSRAVGEGSTRPKCGELLHICRECDFHFKHARDAMVCPECGTERGHCEKYVMYGEDVCGKHKKARSKSLYTRVVDEATTGLFRTLLDEDERSVAKEYQLARIAVSRLVDDEEANPKEVLEVVSTFMQLAERRGRLEQGMTLNVKWDDNMLRAVRGKLRAVIVAFRDVLEEHVPEMADMLMERARIEMRTYGNLRSLPDVEAQIEAVEEAQEPKISLMSLGEES